MLEGKRCSLILSFPFAMLKWRVNWVTEGLLPVPQGFEHFDFGRVKEWLNYDEADDEELDLGDNDNLMQFSTRREQLHTFLVECAGQIPLKSTSFNIVTLRI